MHQGLTFAGVNSQDQNGRAERRIRSLQDLSRCQMIHSYHRWPIGIISNLWPYSIRDTSAIINETRFRCLNYTSTPIHMFSKFKVDSNPRHWKPLFSPVYALAHSLSPNQSLNNGKRNHTRDIFSNVSNPCKESSLGT